MAAASCCGCWRMTAVQLMLLAALAIRGGECDSVNYLVTAGSHFTPGQPYTVGLSSLGSALTSATVAIRREHHDGKPPVVMATSTASDLTGNSCTILLIVGVGESQPTGSMYRLIVNLTNSNGQKFSNSSSVALRMPRSHILIQTDKAVYQPGHLVKYRAVALDADMQPLAGNFTVKVRDSRRNLIDSFVSNATNRPSNMSLVVEGQLRLSHLVNEGNWHVEVSTPTTTESKSFSVRKYTLPKFELSLTVPEFVHANDSEFRVNATVAYTNGKPVPGTMRIKFGPYNTCRSCKPRYDRQTEMSVTTSAINSSVSLTFNLTDWRLQVLNQTGVTWATWYSFAAGAEVTFTERFTGEKKSASEHFTIHKSRYDLKLELDRTEFFIPGMPVALGVKATRPGGSPFSGAAADPLEILLSYRRRGKPQSLLVYSGTVEAALEKTVMINVPSVADYTAVTIKATATVGESKKQASATVNPYMAVTDAYVNGSVTANEGSLKFNLKKFGDVTNMALASLLSSGLHDWKMAATSDNSELITDFMKPATGLTQSVTFVGLGVTSTGEIVASSVTHEYDNFLGNVSLSSNLTADTAEPQAMAEIRIGAQPNSLVCLAGIDHSVNLVQTGQDIDRQAVLNKLASSARFSPRWRRRQAVTTGRILNDNDLILLTDGFYFSEEPELPLMMSTYRAKSARLSMDMSPAPGGNAESAAVSPPKKQIRKLFPESMLWSAVQTDATGMASVTVKLPDTITSWDVTAFALASKRPIQTMETPLKLVTHKSFFVRPILPTSIVQGEKFVLKVLVFNYETSVTSVDVSLRLDDAAFEASAVSGHSMARRTATELTVTLATPKEAMAAFELTPRQRSFAVTDGRLQPPTVPIQVVGAARVGATTAFVDEVRRSLRVRPPGRRVEQTLTSLVGAGDCDAGQCERLLLPTRPQAAPVPGSQIVVCSVSGDLLGPSLTNLDRLVRVPTGCGEQNLATMAPAVSLYTFVVRTNATGVTDDVRSRALKAMRIGYQRQLTYRRRDGSFSAFGDKDRAGNVWLTGFVLSVFVRASEFVTVGSIGEFRSSIEFLLRQQQRNGEFREPEGSFLLDSSLQGESGASSMSSNAFICTCLLDVLEYGTNANLDSDSARMLSRLRSGVELCTMYLTEAVAENSDDEGDIQQLTSLDWALTAYALRRAQISKPLANSQAQLGVALALARARQALTSLAVVTPEGVAWQRVTSWGSRDFCVETSAYALMEQTLSADEPDPRILRWLAMRRDSSGGFGGTQATVVGVRAMAEFAQRFRVTSDPKQSLRLSVRWVTESEPVDSSRWSHAFDVTSENRLQLQTAALVAGNSVTNGQAVLKFEGSSVAMVTVLVRYHVSEFKSRALGNEWTGNASLALRVADSRMLTSDTLNSTFCARAIAAQGMHILSVEAPSGFKPNRHSETGHSSLLRRVDSEQDKVVFYFTRLLPTPFCVYITWQRFAPVLKTQPQLVTLERYYQPEQRVFGYYTPEALRTSAVCDVCPECAGC